MGKQVLPIRGENVLTSEERADMSALAPCNHKVADSRIMAHILVASLHGH